MTKPRDEHRLRERRRATFDEVAELYDRVRPGYPEPLFDDLAAWSGLGRRARVLEIGCGTGKATIALARRGWRVTALEPGASLARVARRKLARLPNVRIEERTFEDWPGRAGSFDLVFAAQSFHFVDPAIGLPKVARLLRPGGVFALATYRLGRGGAAVDRRIERAYERVAFALLHHEHAEGWEDRIDAARRFGTVFRCRYLCRRRYSAADYVALMETQSHHRLLPPARRARLLAAIGRAVRAGGGSIVIPQPVKLYLARRSPG
jgi:SAM-dependent methyltransferase